MIDFFTAFEICKDLSFTVVSVLLAYAVKSFLMIF